MRKIKEPGAARGTPGKKKTRKVLLHCSGYNTGYGWVNYDVVLEVFWTPTEDVQGTGRHAAMALGSALRDDLESISAMATPSPTSDAAYAARQEEAQAAFAWADARFGQEVADEMATEELSAEAEGSVGVVEQQRRRGAADSDGDV